jgi:hypothetical protein
MQSHFLYSHHLSTGTNGRWSVDGLHFWLSHICGNALCTSHPICSIFVCWMVHCSPLNTSDIIYKVIYSHWVFQTDFSSQSRDMLIPFCKGSHPIPIPQNSYLIPSYLSSLVVYLINCQDIPSSLHTLISYLLLPLIYTPLFLSVPMSHAIVLAHCMQSLGP